MQFLEFLEDFGLDPSQILRGIELGLDADLPGLLDAMIKAMQQIVQAAEDELEAGSPSRKFIRLFQGVMEGARIGIDSALALPRQAMQRAVTGIMQPAMAAVPIMAGSVYKTVTLNMGGVQVYDAASQATLVSQVEQVTLKALRR
jgi:hypothetical protein